MVDEAEEEPLDPSLARDMGIRGDRCALYAYRAPDGSVPLLEAFDNFQMHDHLKGTYAARLQRAAQDGMERLKGDHYHKYTKEMDKALAARIHGVFKDINSKTRIPCFFDGRKRLVLTHLIEGKKEDKLNEKDKLVTINLVDEYHARKAELAQQRSRPTRPGRAARSR